MQSYKDGEVEGFETGAFEELAEKLSSKMESGEADYGVIGELPEPGDEIEINGLKCTVQQVTKSGNIVLEPKGEKP